MFNKNKITLETRDNKLEKIKKKGFKKAFFTTVMSMGVLLGCTGMLVGCGEAGPKGDTGAQGPQGVQGEQGVPGAAGSMWFTGTAVTGTGAGIEVTVANTKIGDIYFNTTTCDLYQCVAENTWNWISNLKGDAGQEGQPGSTGATGAAWLTGTDVTGTGSEINATVANAKVGDLYFNTETCDIYECVAENTWNWISNIKGNQGETGETGPQGEAGKDGTSVYVGYDGYIWCGTEKTDFKVEDNTLSENVVENTIGVESAMSKYFVGSYLDLSTNTVALMANYKSNAKLTQYSEATVDEIKIVAEKAGELYIGTAKVADIVNARTTGATYTATTKAYTVEAGLNTITFTTPIKVAEDETIVLGGNGSVGLYTAQGITFDDEDGNYTLINGQANTDVISTTNDIKDTLAIGVHISGIGEVSLYPNIATYETEDLSNYTGLQLASAPFVLKNYEIYENKTISKIKLPVTKVLEISSTYTFTLSLLSQDYTTATTKTDAYTHILQEYTLDLTDYIGDLTTTDVLKWISIDVSDLNITVAEGQTLGFGKSSDNVLIGLDKTVHSSTFTEFSIYYAGCKGSTLSQNLFLDVFVSGKSYETHLNDLQKAEEEAIENNKIAELRAAVQNKTLAILGDSISTNGILDNYEGSVDDVWWKQTMDKLGMTLTKNNSISGSKVYAEVSEGGSSSGAWYSRCEDLADDEGNEPDIIGVFMGTNDFRQSVECGTEIDFDSVETEGFVPTNFGEAYAVMIYKMMQKYSNADVFCLTILDSCDREIDDVLEEYNNMIKFIANHYGCTVVDIYTETPLNDNATYYTDGLHPNVIGMDFVSESFENALRSK